MEILTRRELLRKAGEMALASLPLATMAPGPRIGFRPQTLPAPALPEITIAQISGLHETPVGDGSKDLDLAFDHFKRWKVLHTTIINPTSRWLSKAREANIPFVARLHDEYHNNLFDIDTFEKFAEPLKDYPEKVIAQLFNEITNPKETKGRRIYLPDHTKQHIIPAGIATLDANLVPAIPPFDQTYNGLFEFRQTLEVIKAQKSAAWIRDNWVVTAHNYTFAPGQYIWRDLLVMVDIMEQVLGKGKSLNIHVTEAGPNADFYEIYGERAFVAETRRTLAEAIHYKLVDLLKTYNLWLYANEAQRGLLPQTEEGQQDMRKFEQTAYIGLGEDGQIYEKPVAIAAAEIKTQLTA